MRGGRHRAARREGEPGGAAGQGAPPSGRPAQQGGDEQGDGGESGQDDQLTGVPRVGRGRWGVVPAGRGQRADADARPRASGGSASTQPGRSSAGSVNRPPSGWRRPRFSSKTSRYRLPSPRVVAAIW
ncbi:hypothetical protein FJK98_13885 [Micromonospora sp. HM134]|uniref:hypothetical protein n=1 Tax=Micromonospora sp. HM134 TaxID=2583243 RepID=UPI001198BDDE|nr:hypothetical protein [Micromonospora sp. HM134]QDY08111.1 hypothetical protein FJK98_13885 [Micromonospora sp. HM134]